MCRQDYLGGKGGFDNHASLSQMLVSWLPGSLFCQLSIDEMSYRIECHHALCAFRRTVRADWTVCFGANVFALFDSRVLDYCSFPSRFAFLLAYPNSIET